jgi:hypothetical protein
LQGQTMIYFQQGLVTKQTQDLWFLMWSTSTSVKCVQLSTWIMGTKQCRYCNYVKLTNQYCSAHLQLLTGENNSLFWATGFFLFVSWKVLLFCFSVRIALNAAAN